MKGYLNLIPLVLFVGAGVVMADQSQGTPPPNAVVVDTEVGSTASALGKISVTLEICIERQGISETLQFRESGDESNWIDDVPLSDADLIAAKLDFDSDAASDGKTVNEENVGAVLAIGTTEFQKQQVVTIKDATRQFSDSIYISPDNAAVVSKMVHRAQRISAWLQPRVKDLATGVAQKS
jgi:dihydrodipicolinate reductase